MNTVYVTPSNSHSILQTGGRAVASGAAAAVALMFQCLKTVVPLATQLSVQTLQKCLYERGSCFLMSAVLRYSTLDLQEHIMCTYVTVCVCITGVQVVDMVNSKRLL
jgi:hypothetical protein